ncbi:MAG TPA: RNA 2',3'-cyclic phosphodiesterase [Micropruina sp.]|nr:RNA 2',3'-cyclic phosphodiesterase [Micropruina sp.]
MTLRLFAAVFPPADVLDTLDLFVEPRRVADDNLRWVRRDNWHLTLAFFGDVHDDHLEPLQHALDEVTGTPFTLTLDGAGTFPNPSQARVLYRATTTGSDALSALSRRVRTAAERVGVPSDNAKHQPHLTLARTRRPAPLTRWLGIVDSFPPQAFTVDSFALIRSDLHPSGPAYRLLHTVDLAGRPDCD